jgi:hypothetical protein|tara:strand:- start:200 stop:469 length:270 start_codon:yes stop_codon:yes gene_type:complete
MKQVILIIISIFFSATILYADTDCKKKYGGILQIKSYNKCMTKGGVKSTTKSTEVKPDSKTKATMKKIFGKLNTDSTLFKTGKYSKKDK